MTFQTRLVDVVDDLLELRAPVVLGDALGEIVEFVGVTTDVFQVGICRWVVEQRVRCYQVQVLGNDGI